VHQVIVLKQMKKEEEWEDHKVEIEVDSKEVIWEDNKVEIEVDSKEEIEEDNKEVKDNMEKEDKEVMKMNKLGKMYITYNIDSNF